MKTPKKVSLRKETYRIVFERGKWFCREWDGEVIWKEHLVRLASRLSEEQRIRAFIHEMLHIATKKMKITHKQIYTLEDNLYELLKNVL